MAWELFTEWADLQFVNYSVSEEFEDGTIGVWKLEDWDIYGPGGGGYSSSGPFGNWEADILAWLNNGSMLARDIIDWDAVELQSHNISAHTQGLVRQHPTTYYINGTSYLPQDPNPTFGLAGTAQYTVGDIVVTGARWHSDQSITYRFASYDPFTNQPVTWVENVTFLDRGRTDGDANVIRFDLADAEAPLTVPEQQAVVVIRQGVEEIIASLRALDQDSYFQVEGWGRIRVAELVSLFTLADWKIIPASSYPIAGTLGQVNRNDGDPELTIARERLLDAAGDRSLLLSYLVHEITHTTRAATEHRAPTYNVDHERRTNDVTRAILTRIGMADFVFQRPLGGYGSTNIEYRSNVPTV